MNLYTDQIMDNLVRASQGLPIVQIDYTAIQGTVTDDLTAAGTFDQTSTRSKVFDLIKGAFTSTRTIVNDVKGSLTGDHKIQLTVTGTPVTNNDEVYRAYLEFLTLPGSLQLTCEPPACGEAHIVKKCEQKYVWVPAMYHQEFMRLSLVTTVLRGQPFSVPDSFERVIIDAVPEKQLKPELKQWRIVLVLDQKLPNDNGTTSVTVDGKPYPLDLFLYKPLVPKPEPDPTIAYGRPIDRLTTIYSELNAPKLAANDFANLLKGQKVKISLQSFNPRVPTPVEDLLKQINTNVGQIRLDLLGRPFPQ